LEEFISVNADTRPGKVVALWRWLTEPAALADAAWSGRAGDASSLDAGNAIQIQDERERSRLLASMIIVILPTIVLVGMVLMPLVSRADSLWQSATFLPATIATIGSVVAFGLNRGGHFRPAAAVYTLVFVAAPILAVSRSSGLMNVSIGTLSVGGGHHRQRPIAPFDRAGTGGGRGSTGRPAHSPGGPGHLICQSGRPVQRHPDP
jgi:hypothetical protein